MATRKASVTRTATSRQIVPVRPAPVWSTACPDWERRLVAGESLIPFAPLFPAEAEAGLEVMKALRIVDAPGSPTVGESCRPWVFDFAGALFGSYNPETGERLITEYLLCVSKKNWKSGLAASIMLTLLLRNWRMGAELLIISPTIEVANNSFFAARDSVQADPELLGLLHIKPHFRTIEHRVTGAVLKVVAANAETVSGKKAAFVLFDELWLFGMRDDAENMMREATGGLAARPEGCVIYLTTQSDSPPAGVFRQKLRYARDVRDGRKLDRQFLPVLYDWPQAMLEADGWRDPANFYVTNPNLGLSVGQSFLVREFAKAEDSGPESLRGFASKHLNVEIGLRLQSDRWPGAVLWPDQAVEGGLALEELLARSDAVVIGIDPGGLEDWMGMAVIGREAGTSRWLGWTRAWVYAKALEKFKGEAPRWRDFQEDGDLVIVERVGADVDEMVELVLRVQSGGVLVKIGMDTGGYKIIHEAMVLGGVGPELFIGIRQNWGLMAVTKLLERKLAQGTFLHGGQAMMDYCVSNARMVEQGNANWITKAVSKGKIDPLMALLDAAECMALAPAPVDVDAMIAPA